MMKRRTQTFKGRLVARHGVNEVRRELESMWNDPAPAALNFSWASVPKKSSTADIIPGADVALRFVDGSVIVGRVVDESRYSIRFRAWGCCSEKFFAKSEIDGVRVVGAHTYAERRAVTERQAAARGTERIRELTRDAGGVGPSALR